MGMSDGQADRERVEFVASISDDVMKSLVSRSFFEELDSRLCPKGGGGPRVLCDHSYRISTSILAELGFQAEDVSDVFDVLRSKGGFCDCEILYNAVEESRLKAEYWKSKVGEVSTSQNGGC
jgi:Protein of unknown function (DUF2695)